MPRNAGWCHCICLSKFLAQWWWLTIWTRLYDRCWGDHRSLRQCCGRERWSRAGRNYSLRQIVWLCHGYRVLFASSWRFAWIGDPRERFHEFSLWSTFTSVPDVYLRILPCKIGKFLRLHRLSKIGWRNDQRIGDITAPILFISGTKDRLTPNSMTYELHERATRSVRKHIYNVKNGKHTALYKTDL